MRVEVDRELLDQVAARDLHALEGTPLAVRHRIAANVLYRERDEAKREEGFARLNLQLFEHRGHADAVHEAFREAPRAARALEKVLVLKASQRRDEDVDLVPGETTTLRMRLTADRFAEGSGLRAYLARQLVQVGDLLDPAFGYVRTERLAANPTEDGLLRDRYRLFWELTVLGRLGATPEREREERRLRGELDALYARLPAASRVSIFERFTRGPRPAHAELLAVARDLAKLCALAGVAHDPAASGPHLGGACPLCGFPTHAWRSTPLAPPVLRDVLRDFPRWEPERGLCDRCADLYDLRHPEAWAVAN